MPPRRIRRIPASLATPRWDPYAAKRVCAAAPDVVGLRTLATAPSTADAATDYPASANPDAVGQGCARRAQRTLRQRGLGLPGRCQLACR